MSDLLDDIMKEMSENGVYVRFESVTENSCEGEIVMVKKFSRLDFSEHDNVFEDKIAKLEVNIGYYKDSLSRTEKNCDKLYHENKELKQRIAELESKETSDLPFDPLETANYIINATYERETSSLERAFAKVPDRVDSYKYTIDELEQIAEHLLIYCKHNKESEE